MTEQDKPRFAAYLVALAEIYDTQLSEAKITLYFQALEDLSIDEIDRACSAVVRIAKFFPRPVELREAVRGNGDDAAQIALATLKDAMRSVGGYRSVTFADRTINAVVQAMGGWDKLCSTPESEWRWLEKDFLKIYRAYVAQGIQGPAMLTGIVDHANDMTGYTPALMAAMGISTQDVVTIHGPERALPTQPQKLSLPYDNTEVTTC